MDRLRTRHLFGGPLGRMQYWQFKMAERAPSVEMARSLYRKAAIRLDRGARSAEPG
ncbi:acyl-CoA dehydrogenase family protein [Nocardia jinanensis]|uniref:Acyl-CoA dehydrogenase/oxidase C-terminal domain-containing protein n=1 Tax=Nocardia jinanensis TaxID=382504 RepID=A0A917RMW1_9NOCA|nr:acyl-CoA dehydrogenase family protein [Nocardia jinanensis]GGL16046.1 hypothetical protein GCM10011588_33400 [Nocardia jinanensis]